MSKECVAKRKDGTYRSWENCPVRFYSRESAAAFNSPKEYNIVESIGTCKRCGKRLYPSDIDGYTSQCFECDEDFYSFEQVTDDG